MDADFTIRNSSDFNVKDIKITCYHYASSGTQIDRNTRTIYELFAARSTRHLKKFNMGFIHSQAEASSCRIMDFVVMERVYALQDEPISTGSAALGRKRIVEIQQHLNALGYDIGGPDGVAGPNTQRGIRTFQRDADLPQDGKATQELLETLRVRVAKQTNKTGHENDKAMLIQFCKEAPHSALCRDL